MWGPLKKQSDRENVTLQFYEDFHGTPILKDKTSIIVKRGKGTIEDPTVYIVKHGVRHIYSRDPYEPWHDAYNWNAYVYQEVDDNLNLMDRLEFEDYELTMSFIEHNKNLYSGDIKNSKRVKIFDLPEHPEHGKQRIICQMKEDEWHIVEDNFTDHYIGSEPPKNAREAMELLKAHEGEEVVYGYVQAGYSNC